MLNESELISYIENCVQTFRSKHFSKTAEYLTNLLKSILQNNIPTDFSDTLQQIFIKDGKFLFKKCCVEETTRYVFNKAVVALQEEKRKAFEESLKKFIREDDDPFRDVFDTFILQLFDRNPPKNPNLVFLNYCFIFFFVYQYRFNILKNFDPSLFYASTGHDFVIEFQHIRNSIGHSRIKISLDSQNIARMYMYDIVPQTKKVNWSGCFTTSQFYNKTRQMDNFFQSTLLTFILLGTFNALLELINLKQQANQIQKK